MRLVYVEWYDAHGCGDFWGDAPEPNDQPKALVVRSIGWIVAESDDAIVVAPHFANPATGPQIVGDMTIPKGCVVRMVDVNEPAPE